MVLVEPCDAHKHDKGFGDPGGLVSCYTLYDRVSSFGAGRIRQNITSMLMEIESDSDYHYNIDPFSSKRDGRLP